MRKLIGLVVLVVAVLVAYNYFYGDEQEQESAERIVNEVKNLGKSVTALVKQQKQKYDEGEYDAALEKVGDFVKNLKAKSKDLGSKAKDGLDDLEKEYEKLQNQTKERTSEGKELNEDMQKDLNKVLKKADDLMKEIEKK